MRQIAYFSTASGRQDPIVIAAILAASRDRNLREGVTGLLVAGGHRYLQVIEGPAEIIEALLTRIRRDDRHVGVSVLVYRTIERRSFQGWSMAYSAEPELDEFATFRDLAGVMRAHIADRKLREQVDCFAHTFATSPLRLDAAPWQIAHYGPGDLLDAKASDWRRH